MVPAVLPTARLIGFLRWSVSSGSQRLWRMWDAWQAQLDRGWIVLRSLEAISGTRRAGFALLLWMWPVRLDELMAGLAGALRDVLAARFGESELLEAMLGAAEC